LSSKGKKGRRGVPLVSASDDRYFIGLRSHRRAGLRREPEVGWGGKRTITLLRNREARKFIKGADFIGRQSNGRERREGGERRKRVGRKGERSSFSRRAGRLAKHLLWVESKREASGKKGGGRRKIREDLVWGPQKPRT